MDECIKKVILIYTILFITVIHVHADVMNALSEQVNSTLDKLKFVEVPDSSLILLDRVKLRSNIVARARQKVKKGMKQEQTTQNVTTVKPPSSPSPVGLGPCTCSMGVCKCCTGYVLDLFNQKACMRVTYNPGDFAFDVAMSLNDRVLYENSMSGKNPQPICITPPRMPRLKVCAKFYDVYFPGRNFHFCLAMTGEWRSLQLFNMAFDCLRMGSNGIAMVKPGENDGLVVVNPQGGYDAVIDAGEDDVEDYDENVVKSLMDMFDR